MEHCKQIGLLSLRGRVMKQPKFSLNRSLMLWSALLLTAISSAVLAAPPSNLEAVPDVDVTAEKPKTAEEALQTILGDLTVEEFNNILTQEINAEIIRKLYPSLEDNK
jgi:hypothetical protein